MSDLDNVISEAVANQDAPFLVGMGRSVAPSLRSAVL